MQFKKILIMGLVVIGLASCKSYETVPYFQDLKDPSNLPVLKATNNTLKLAPADKLNIVVSSALSPDIAVSYNLPLQSSRIGASTTTSGSSYSTMPYMIDSKGDIDFPVVGKIRVAGMTREEVEVTIKNILVSNRLLNDAVVTCEVLNHFVNVLGDVRTPGRIAIEKDNLTILEAIAKCGDLNITGERQSVMVIRQQGDQQKVYTIDVPVSVAGKYSFSDKITAMANLGVKFQFPIKATYKVTDGSKRTSTGYFQDANVVLSKIPHQGFYTLEHVLDGVLYTKDLTLAAFLDLGVMQKIGSQRFYYGVYGQLGVTPLNVETSNEFLTQFGIYNSPLNTTEIDKIRLVSLGIKLGYVLPIKTNAEEAEKTEEDNTSSVNDVIETESVNGEESK